ncbi:hypothetical protein BC827DRAFT_1252260 [Russula dissimulans]|nr:hypothetical protein BC827DRAFT_1252260 [Russula dissimulans]
MKVVARASLTVLPLLVMVKLKDDDNHGNSGVRSMSTGLLSRVLFGENLILIRYVSQKLSAQAEQPVQYGY